MSNILEQERKEKILNNGNLLNLKELLSEIIDSFLIFNFYKVSYIELVNLNMRLSSNSFHHCFISKTFFIEYNCSNDIYLIHAASNSDIKNLSTLFQVKNDNFKDLLPLFKTLFVSLKLNHYLLIKQIHSLHFLLLSGLMNESHYSHDFRDYDFISPHFNKVKPSKFIKLLYKEVLTSEESSLFFTFFILYRGFSLFKKVGFSNYEDLLSLKHTILSHRNRYRVLRAY